MSKTARGYIECQIQVSGQKSTQVFYVLPGIVNRRPGKVHGRFHEDGSNSDVTVDRVFFESTDEMGQAGYLADRFRGFAFVGSPRDNVRPDGRFNRVNSRLSGVLTTLD